MNDIEDLWYSLSFLFVDNEIDYQAIAKQISRFDISTIEFHFLYNVAPVCSINLEQTIPPIWSGFDKKELLADIKEHSIVENSQVTFRKKIAAKLYKYKYRNDLRLLKTYLNNPIPT